MMIRVMIIKETYNEKIMFLFGGTNSKSCIEEIQKFVEHNDITTVHFKNENELFEKFSLVK